jgi:hypothetical protein
VTHRWRGSGYRLGPFQRSNYPLPVAARHGQLVRVAFHHHERHAPRHRALGYRVQFIIDRLDKHDVAVPSTLSNQQQSHPYDRHARRKRRYASSRLYDARPRRFVVDHLIINKGSALLCLRGAQSTTNSDQKSMPPCRSVMGRGLSVLCITPDVPQHHELQLPDG